MRLQRRASSELIADAICSPAACLIGNVSVGAGVRLTVTDPSSAVSSVILLPGIFDSTTPSINGSAGLLAPFLSTVGVAATRAAGFDVFKPAVATSTGVSVQVDYTSGVIVFTEAGYGGVVSTGAAGASASGVVGIRSALLAENTTASFNVSGGSSTGPQTLQLWDALVDIQAAGLGNITLSAVAVQSVNSTSWCPRGQYRLNATACANCSPACSTCWGPEVNDCLSCDSADRLGNGRCTTSLCTGGVMTALGTCLETFKLPASNVTAAPPAAQSVSLGLIVGPSIGGTLVLVAVVALIVHCVRKRRQSRYAALLRLHGQKPPLFDLSQPRPSGNDPWGFEAAQRPVYPAPVTPAPPYTPTPIKRGGRPASIVDSVVTDDDSRPRGRPNWVKRATRAFASAPKPKKQPPPRERSIFEDEPRRRTWFERWRPEPTQPRQTRRRDEPPKPSSRGNRSTGLTWVNDWSTAVKARPVEDVPPVPSLPEAYKPVKTTKKSKKRMTHITLGLTEAENWTEARTAFKDRAEDERRDRRDLPADEDDWRDAKPTREKERGDDALSEWHRPGRRKKPRPTTDDWLS